MRRLTLALLGLALALSALPASAAITYPPKTLGSGSIDMEQTVGSGNVGSWGPEPDHLWSRTVTGYETTCVSRLKLQYKVEDYDRGALFRPDPSFRGWFYYRLYAVNDSGYVKGSTSYAFHASSDSVNDGDPNPWQTLKVFNVGKSPKTWTVQANISLSSWSSGVVFYDGWGDPYDQEDYGRFRFRLRAVDKAGDGCGAT